ncbi:hypothetical protein [Pelagicoccus sp. SDUM812003]|uniref:hypothetical protein n=1 Tax=Pelagicoccus sp. SDUM812003 TaxID=3041267 RepID=UPI00280FFB88|nr:hypothetical protein [Pelagicoccus sp. SDUM812003]MDQ8205731.1 hypothetical protein [Pelagicoccus sp. SDUM812003]
MSKLAIIAVFTLSMAVTFSLYMLAASFALAAFGPGEFEVTETMRIKEAIGTRILSIMNLPVFWTNNGNLRLIISTAFWGTLFSVSIWKLFERKRKVEPVSP